MKELHSLASSAHIQVADQHIQVRKEIHPKYYIGKGKLEELIHDISALCIETVIFDNDLTPHQVKNIESIIKCKAVGRTELILDIFAKRARTKEARLQVEYAQLSYLMPRLTRKWTHLSRVEGGIGFRGPGETQLEVDRRAIKRRLYSIKKQLTKISIQFETRRKLRKDQNMVCLVGYTNAGKSTLMNLLTKGNHLVDDAPFATLDSTIRQLYLCPDLKVLLVDTVGFIKKLPHHLIRSFMSTLEEVKQAKLLLHIIDVTQGDPLARIDSVNQVLSHLESKEKPTIYIFNKIDQLPDDKLPTKWFAYADQSCFISAKSGEGVDQLKAMIRSNFSKSP